MSNVKLVTPPKKVITVILASLIRLLVFSVMFSTIVPASSIAAPYVYQIAAEPPPSQGEERWKGTDVRGIQWRYCDFYGKDIGGMVAKRMTVIMSIFTRDLHMDTRPWGYGVKTIVNLESKQSG